MVRSRVKGHDDTGLGNDFSGWESYKDKPVLYGSVVIGDSTGVVLVWAMHDDGHQAIQNAMAVLGDAEDSPGNPTRQRGKNQEFTVFRHR